MSIASSVDTARALTQHGYSDEIFASVQAVANSKFRPEILAQVELDTGIEIKFSRMKYILMGSWKSISAARCLLEEHIRCYGNHGNLINVEEEFGSTQSMTSSSTWRRDIVNGFDNFDGPDLPRRSLDKDTARAHEPMRACSPVLSRSSDCFVSAVSRSSSHEKMTQTDMDQTDGRDAKDHKRQQLESLHKQEHSESLVSHTADDANDARGNQQAMTNGMGELDADNQKVPEGLRHDLMHDNYDEPKDSRADCEIAAKISPREAYGVQRYLQHRGFYDEEAGTTVRDHYETDNSKLVETENDHGDATSSGNNQKHIDQQTVGTVKDVKQKDDVLVSLGEHADLDFPGNLGDTDPDKIDESHQETEQDKDGIDGNSIANGNSEQLAKHGSIDNTLETFRPVLKEASDKDDDDDDDYDGYDNHKMTPFQEEIMIDQNLYEYMQQMSVEDLNVFRDKYKVSITVAMRGDFGLALLKQNKGQKMNLSHLASAREEFTTLYQNIMLTCAEEICELPADIPIEQQEVIFAETIMQYPGILIQESPPKSRRHIFVGPHRTVSQARHFFKDKAGMSNTGPTNLQARLKNMMKSRTAVPGGVLCSEIDSPTGKVAHSDYRPIRHLQCKESANLLNIAETTLVNGMMQGRGNYRDVDEARLESPATGNSPAEEYITKDAAKDKFFDMPALVPLSPVDTIDFNSEFAEIESRRRDDKDKGEHDLKMGHNAYQGNEGERYLGNKNYFTPIKPDENVEKDDRAVNGLKGKKKKPIVEWMSDDSTASSSDGDKVTNEHNSTHNGSAETNGKELRGHAGNRSPAVRPKSLKNPEVVDDLPVPQTNEGLQKMRESIVSQLREVPQFDSKNLVDALMEAQEIEQVGSHHGATPNHSKPHQSTKTRASAKAPRTSPEHRPRSEAMIQQTSLKNRTSPKNAPAVEPLIIESPVPEFKPTMLEDGSIVNTCDANYCTNCTKPVMKTAQLQCGHRFCVDCIRKPRCMAGDVCPECGVSFTRERLGQPEGDMTHIMDKKTNLPNFQKYPTLLVKWAFPAGSILGNDGQPRSYPNTDFETFLPNNEEGRSLFKLFLRVHKAGKLFEALSVKGVNATIQPVQGLSLMTDHPAITQKYLASLLQKITSLDEQ